LLPLESTPLPLRPDSPQELERDELKDVNRGRAYLANVADRHGITVYQSLDAALEEVVSLVHARRLARVAADAAVSGAGECQAAAAPQPADAAAQVEGEVAAAAAGL
jgi:hypothetical protein